MISPNILDHLKSTTPQEAIFLMKRALHLKYNHQGRFGDIEVSESERASLASIHEFYTEVAPKPLTVIHGIAPRSGTNYILDLLRVHPDVLFDPESLPEIPLLSIAQDAQSLQKVFLKRYIGNNRSLHSLEMLSHICHGALTKVHHKAPEQMGLFKVPHVHHLNLFPVLFPSYKLIICVRDGRDVVSSAMKTWKKSSIFKRNFKDYCREWARSAEIIHTATQHFDDIGFEYEIVKYEDAFHAPAKTAQGLASYMGVDPNKITDNMYSDMAVRGSSQGGLSGDIDWEKNNIKRDASFNPIGRWTTWSDKQKSLFDSIAGEMMQVMGYK